MADAVGRADDEAFVVDAGERFACDFVGFEEVVEIGGGEVLAEIAVACWVDGRELLAVFGIFDVDAAIGSVKRAVASLASGGDAIECVATIFDANE